MSKLEVNRKAKLIIKNGNKSRNHGLKIRFAVWLNTDVCDSDARMWFLLLFWMNVNDVCALNLVFVCALLQNCVVPHVLIAFVVVFFVLSCISHFSHHNLWKVAFFFCCLLKYKCILLYSRIRLQTNDQINIHSVLYAFIHSSDFFFFVHQVNETCDWQNIRVFFIEFPFCSRFIMSTPPENLSIWQKVRSNH